MGSHPNVHFTGRDDGQARNQNSGRQRGYRERHEEREIKRQCFDVKDHPFITFESTKIVQTAHETYEVDGDFTIRGVTNPEKLTLTISGKGTGSGEIKGAMVFNCKDYGMNKGIPFIKIADHVDVNFHLKGNRAGGPPLSLQ